MAKRSSGLFSGSTRNLTRHHKPSRVSVRTFIKEFKMGEKVAIVPIGTHRDVPHPRHKGKIGTVMGKRGNAYIVEVAAMNSKRTLIVGVQHLQKLSNPQK